MRRVLVAALVGLSLQALLSTSATAGEQRVSEVVLHDAVGDVWATPVGGDVFAPAPERRNGDITRARLSYREHALVVRVAFARLRPTLRSRVDLSLRTDLGRRQAEVAWSTARPAGAHYVWGANGDMLKCDGVTHLVDREAGVVRLRIPGRCFGNPQWVRGALIAFTESRSTLWTDNPHGSSDLPGHYTRRLYRP